MLLVLYMNIQPDFCESAEICGHLSGKGAKGPKITLTKGKKGKIERAKGKKRGESKIKIARLILIKRDCFTEEVYLASYFKKSSWIYTIYFYSIHLVFFACCSFCFCSCFSNIFSRKSCKLGPFLINSSKLR